MKAYIFGLTALAAIGMTGCGTTGGIMKMGPDTYRVSASKHNMTGGAPGAESDALRLANAHCEQLGKEVLVTGTSSDFDRPFYTYTATFQCLSIGDPDLHRPKYAPAPTTVIEDRRR